MHRRKPTLPPIHRPTITADVYAGIVGSLLSGQSITRPKGCSVCSASVDTLTLSLAPRPAALFVRDYNNIWATIITKLGL